MCVDDQQPDWDALTAEICKPRLAGTPGCREVIGKLSDFLRSRGYDVQCESFSAGPERLLGGSLSGFSVALGSLAIALLLLIGPRPVGVVGVSVWIATLVLLPAILALIVWRITNGHLYSSWLVRVMGYEPDCYRSDRSGPWVETANICAVKGPAPRIWLVSHSDSKVQRLSLLVRMIALLLTLFMLLVLLGLAVASLAGAGTSWVTMALIGLAGAVCVAGGVLIGLAGLQDGSPGAVDNATGIIAALRAAEILGRREDVGLLITGAEELGMMGARQWVESGRTGNLFVNLDGLDSRGKYRLRLHGGTAPGAARWMAAHLKDALPADEKTEIPGWIKRLALYVDGLVFSKAGMAGVTVQRGNLETLGIAHRRSDTLDRIDLEAATEPVAKATAAMVEKLLARTLPELTVG